MSDRLGQSARRSMWDRAIGDEAAKEGKISDSAMLEKGRSCGGRRQHGLGDGSRSSFI